MIKIQAPPFLIVMPFVFALPCFVASVLKSICYFAHWVEQVGLPEDRNAYSVVLRQIAKMRMKSIFVAASLLALALPGPFSGGVDLYGGGLTAAGSED